MHNGNEAMLMCSSGGHTLGFVFIMLSTRELIYKYTDTSVSFLYEVSRSTTIFSVENTASVSHTREWSWVQIREETTYWVREELWVCNCCRVDSFWRSVDATSASKQVLFSAKTSGITSRMPMHTSNSLSS